jgi:undecaprenyl-diphosphatase
MLLKIDKRAAAEFSFFLAIPIMVGAFGKDLWDNKDSLTADNLGIIAVGFVASFVFGFIVIKVMLDFVQKRGFGAVRLVADSRRRRRARRDLFRRLGRLISPCR